MPDEVHSDVRGDLVHAADQWAEPGPSHGAGSVLHLPVRRLAQRHLRAVQGLGSAACGPDVAPEHRLWPGARAFGVVFEDPAGG